MRRAEVDAGYATLTAIILCAAVSILCAGTLTLAATMRKAEERKLERLQLQEAMNSAVLQFAGDIVTNTAPYDVRGEKVIVAQGRRYIVSLNAQSEHAKWPIDKAREVKEANLGRVTRLSKAALLAHMAKGQSNDCVRSLFSDIGGVEPDKDRPMTAGALAITNLARDGQLWRIRAVADGRVEERRVRFLGDPGHLFALVSVERMSLGEMPECRDLIVH